MITRSNFLAALIKSKRKEHNLSQTELSTILGFSTKNGQYLSSIERGCCQFPSKKIAKLACAINVSNEVIIDLMVMDYKECLKEGTNAHKRNHTESH